MAEKLAGICVLRNGKGEFSDISPLEQDLDEKLINPATGLTKQEEKACDAISRMLTHEYTSYCEERGKAVN